MTPAIPISSQHATDGELFAQLAANRADQAAFEELVHRHLEWVYATALRIVREPGHAEDVTQAVLWSLSQKAARLTCHPYVGGWLHEATRFAAGALLRSERRRKERERMVARHNIAPKNVPALDNLQGRLDEAIARLPSLERHIILLRYLQRKSHEEIGAFLGITPEAARKRAARALERLRHILNAKKQPDALGAALAAGPDVKVPAGLSAAVLSGKISVQAALLAKGVTVINRTLALKLIFTAAVAACAGVIVGTYAFGHATSQPPAPPTAISITPGPVAPALPPIAGLRGDPLNRADGVAAIPRPTIISADIGGSGGGGGPGGGGGRRGGGMRMAPGVARVRVMSTGQYNITITTTIEGGVTAQVKDAGGNVVFDGPFATAAQRASIPADQLALIDDLNQPSPEVAAAMGPAQTPLALDAIKKQLGVTDREWPALEENIRAILNCQRFLNTGRSPLSALTWNVPTVADADNPIAGPAQELSNALADNAAKPEDLQLKVVAVRQARHDVEDSQALARQKLEALATPRQRAILVNLRILD